jgi:hypothetical protein
MTTPEKPNGTDSEYESAIALLNLMYAARVYAIEAFNYMLETYAHLTPDQRRKFEACRRLEIAMCRRLFSHLTNDLGLTVRPPGRIRQVAVSLAVAGRNGTWFDGMTDLEGAAIRGVQSCRMLKALYQHRDVNLCATMLASRMALRDFARDELDDLTDVSLDRILALLSAEDRQAIADFDG